MLDRVELFEESWNLLLEGAIAAAVRPRERAALLEAALRHRSAAVSTLGKDRLGRVRGPLSPSTPAERGGLLAVGAAAWGALTPVGVDRLRAGAQRALEGDEEARSFVRELASAMTRRADLAALFDLGLGSPAGRAYLAEHRVEALLERTGDDVHERGGATFRAVHVASRREIELWVGDGDVDDWFQRALRLEGPQVAGPRELFQSGGVSAAVFDRCAGRPLVDVAQDLGSLPRLDLARRLVHAARPLAAAGLLTPHLMADAWLEGQALYVSVRPRAALDPDRLAARGHEWHLLLHGSPERLREPSHRSAQADVFEVASVLFLVLTGRPAFLGHTLEAQLQVKRAPPPLPAELPTYLAHALVDCLQPDPSARPSDLRALEASLR